MNNEKLEIKLGNTGNFDIKDYSAKERRKKLKIEDEREITSKILLNLMIILIVIQTSKNNLKANITLRINGTGNKDIFTSGSYGKQFFNSIYYPNIIYINREKQSVINHTYYFDKNDNFVELIWNNTINYCGFMFYECTSISEINLSNFDTSKVININSLFSGCFSLTSINLSNFDTSNVKKWMKCCLVVRN